MRHIHEKGSRVNRSKQCATIPFAENGLSATPRGLFPAEGLGAPTLRMLCLIAVALTAFLALSESPALAARGHVFSGTFAAEGSGPGQLKEPFGVAVDEASRNVYVADSGNNRVQRFSFNAGSGEYEFASQITAATGSGTGNLAEGSATIESVAAASGAFVVGQTIAAPGIPPATTITAVEEEGARLTISSPVEAGGTGTGVSLSASQSLYQPRAIAVDNDSGSSSAGDIYVSSGLYGQQIIDKFSSSGEFVGQINNLPPATGTGDLEAGSIKVTALHTGSGLFTPGETVSGPGVPPGTTIAECEFTHGCGPGTSELSLSQPATATVKDAPLSAESGPFNLVYGLAVDPAGTLYVFEQHGSLGSPYTLDRFSSTAVNEFEGSCPSPNNLSPSRGLAVDPDHNVYARTSLGNGQAFELNSDCRIVNEKFGTESPATENGVTFFGIAVESVSGEAYVDNVKTIGRFTPGGAEVERFGAGRLASAGCSVESTCLGGLAVDSASGEVFAAVGAGARIVVFGLEPPTLPQLENETVSQVTDDSATLEAELNPRSLAGEAPTEYRFEYGPCPGPPSSCAASPYPSAAPSQALPPSFLVGSVSAPLEGLLPETTYHFRLVAENAHGLVEGAERTFTSRSSRAFTLIDGRAWEMVSPVALHGALIMPLGQGGLSEGAPTQAAADGSSISYAANAPTESDPAGFSTTQQVLSRRGAGGWSSGDLAIPHEVATSPAENGEEVQFFSEDLSLAVVQPLGSFVPLSAAASEQTTYLRNNASGTYTPLVTGCPPEGEPCPPAVEAAADVAPGTVFGQQNQGGHPCPPEKVDCGAKFIGGTADLGHVVLTAHAALTPGAKANALYEWNADQAPSERLQLISLLPPASPGAPELPAPNPNLGSYKVALRRRGAISADGSRVFFSSSGSLYMRDTLAQKTIQLDLVEAGCGGCGGGGTEPDFQLASSNGSRAFFTDTKRLTADASPGGADLYECRVVEGPDGAPECDLTDLTPANGAESAEVQGTVLGAAEDGSSVYFVANGVLAQGAVPGNCIQPSGNEPHPGICNLYVRREGTTTFIASLSGFDSTDWDELLTGLSARVAPDGNWLAFMSQRSLTGYDNRDALSGARDQEVYLYEAQHNRLTCASCSPFGARPQGVEYGGGENVPLLGRAAWFRKTWLAASIPSWVQFISQEALYQPRYLSDTGRLLFDSHDALVSKDTNGTGDVYEFEAGGEGSCSPASTSGGISYRSARTFEGQLDGVSQNGEEGAGCIGLISSGVSKEESALLDASKSGDDVFFLSTAKLSPADVEGSRTVYDAHVCSVAQPCPPPPPPPPPTCSGDACQQPASAPNDPTPASLTFEGAGNLVGCPKGQVEKQKKCVARKHKLKKHKKKGHAKNPHRIANRNRGGQQ